MPGGASRPLCTHSPATEEALPELAGRLVRLGAAPPRRARLTLTTGATACVRATTAFSCSTDSGASNQGDGAVIPADPRPSRASEAPLK